MGRAIHPFAFAQGKARPGDIKDELRDLPPRSVFVQIIAVADAPIPLR